MWSKTDKLKLNHNEILKMDKMGLRGKILANRQEVKICEGKLQKIVWLCNNYDCLCFDYSFGCGTVGQSAKRISNRI